MRKRMMKQLAKIKEQLKCELQLSCRTAGNGKLLMTRFSEETETANKNTEDSWIVGRGAIVMQ